MYRGPGIDALHRRSLFPHFTPESSIMNQIPRIILSRKHRASSVMHQRFRVLSNVEIWPRALLQFAPADMSSLPK